MALKDFVEDGGFDLSSKSAEDKRRDYCSYVLQLQEAHPGKDIVYDEGGTPIAYAECKKED
jgi:hypothetical protein